VQQPGSRGCRLSACRERPCDVGLAMKPWVGAIALCLLVAAPAAAGPAGVVEGTVTVPGGRLTEEPAVVVIDGQAAVTDERGAYVLEEVPAGRQEVHIFVGNGTWVFDVVVIAGGRVRSDHELGEAGFVPQPSGPPMCFSDEECPGWQVCSVSLGDCDSPGAADLCGGVCTAGWLEVGVRAQTAVSDDGLGGALGVELVPPLVGSHVAAAADWTGDTWRLGGVLRLTVREIWAVSLRLDGVTEDDRWRFAAAGRLEWAPPWTPLRHYMSLLAEVGVMAPSGDAAPFASLGLAGWLTLPP
jgi:hypothetical protein